jgi:ppGpp synthetase/RelA/SpoT-type nucleotidyltranferase
MSIDMKWFDEQVGIYEGQRQRYVDFSRVLYDIFYRRVRAMGIGAIVQVRAKEVTSFAEKCIRKAYKYTKPTEQFTDLCGGRIIVESKSQIEPICDYIRRNFEIDSDNSEDVSERLLASEFGYLSVHFIVSFKKGADYNGVDVSEFFGLGVTPGADGQRLTRGPIFRAELQVRTLLQHAWANLVHDNLYKSDFKSPRQMEREAATIAAKLEDIDDSCARLIEEVRSYRSCYGAYMTPEKIRQEIEILEAVHKHDRKNPKLAHKIAQLAIALEDWDKAVQVLSAFQSGDSLSQPVIFRDLGVALSKKNDPKGRVYLNNAAELDPFDADIQCELGDTFFPADEKTSLVYYEKAFNLRPDYPRALRKYIQCRMLTDRDFGIGSLMRPHLESAIEDSLKRAKVGVHLPWAYYDMGFFALLLGRPYDSLNAFTMAVELSTTESPVENTCSLMEMLHERLHDKTGELGRHLEWVIRFFRAATVAKIFEVEEDAAAEAELLGVAAKKARRDLNELKSRQNIDHELLEDAEKNIKKRDEAYQKSLSKSETWKIKAVDAPFKYLIKIDGRFKGKRSFVTPRADGDPVLFDKSKPVVIVAGGCDANVEQKVSEYSGLLEFAFEGFQGTIISGGTRAGISGIVGDLGRLDTNSKIRKLAYLPKSIDQVHEAYTIRTIQDTGFSPLGPIQAWIDLLASGFRPSEIRLIGINGGPISAFEYRLGLAFGAKVSIFHGSGREAAKIATDPDWKSNHNLIMLPMDKETVHLFIQPPSGSKNIDEYDKEKLAKMAHEAHRMERGSSLIPPDPIMADWEDLNESFRTSSLKQIDHIEAKLQIIGLMLRKVKGRDIELFAFKEDQINELAKLEHARWNVERLMDGWKPGERDPQNKTSPYLIPWDELPADAQKWDRLTVARLPERLKGLGYEVYNPADEKGRNIEGIR